MRAPPTSYGTVLFDQPLQWRGLAQGPPAALRVRLDDAFAAGQATVRKRLLLTGLALFDLDVAPEHLPGLHAALTAAGLQLDVPWTHLPVGVERPVITVVLSVSFQPDGPPVVE